MVEEKKVFGQVHEKGERSADFEILLIGRFFREHTCVQRFQFIFGLRRRADGIFEGINSTHDDGDARYDAQPWGQTGYDAAFGGDLAVVVVKIIYCDSGDFNDQMRVVNNVKALAAAAAALSEGGLWTCVVKPSFF